MKRSPESTSTKIANAIRKTASELMSWAVPTSDWPHGKEGYKSIPLGIAIIAIVFSLTVFAGILYSLVAWVL